MRKYHALLLSILFFLFLAPSSAATARECSITPYQPPTEDVARLNAGSVGKWNNTFAQTQITVTDLDGKKIRYFALQKKPDNQTHAPLILFLHGFPEFSWAWEKQLDYFGSHMHAVALDLKGHHYSDAPEATEEYNFIKLAWELRFIIQCLGYEQATIVGHDFGGGLAWTMGMMQPDVVKNLIVMNTPHPYRFGRELLNPNGEQARASKYIGYAQGTNASDLAHFNSILLSDFSIFNSGFYSNRRILRLVQENWLPTNRWNKMKSYYREMPYPATESEFPEKLSGMMLQVYRIKAPTLLIWGMKDPYFVDAVLDNLEGLIPDLEIKKYPDATHWVNHEASDLNQQIEQFIVRHNNQN